jgi:hypothetical protein
MIRLGRNYGIIPDTQTREGVPINHLHWASMYFMDKAPDAIVHLGDGADMPSLSSYDKRGSKRSERLRIQKDVDAWKRGMEALCGPWEAAGWRAEKTYLLGNHEFRWWTALNNEPHLLEGMFEEDDPFSPFLRSLGWTVHPFLKIVTLDGVRYCHFFPHGPGGRVGQTKRGAPSALAQVQRQMASATAGHMQGLDIATVSTDLGLRRGLIAGSFYLHNEHYLHGLDRYWRGLIMKNDVRNGMYALCEVEMDFLRAKYRRLEPPGRKVA